MKWGKTSSEDIYSWKVRTVPSAVRVASWGPNKNWHQRTYTHISRWYTHAPIGWAHKTGQLNKTALLMVKCPYQEEASDSLRDKIE